jgi:hypothetical protein
VEDGGGDAVVVGGGTAGEVGLFEDAAEGGAVERLRGAIVVALGAVGFEDAVAADLLGVEFREWCGGWGGVAAGEACDESDAEEGEAIAAAGCGEGEERDVWFWHARSGPRVMQDRVPGGGTRSC